MSDITPFISETDIQKRIVELGKEIRKDYGDETIVLICVLKGAVLFYADLIRQIGGPVEMEFCKAASYGDGTKSSGEVKIDYQFTRSLDDKHVIFVEDIVDTGLTTYSLMEQTMKEQKPKSLKLASLLSKPSRREKEVHIDYLGFEIEDKFVIGYGLDYAQKYRELPYIGVLNAD